MASRSTKATTHPLRTFAASSCLSTYQYATYHCSIRSTTRAHPARSYYRTGHSRRSSAILWSPGPQSNSRTKHGPSTNFLFCKYFCTPVQCVYLPFIFRYHHRGHHSWRIILTRAYSQLIALWLSHNRVSSLRKIRKPTWYLPPAMDCHCHASVHPMGWQVWMAMARAYRAFQLSGKVSDNRWSTMFLVRSWWAWEEVSCICLSRKRTRRSSSSTAGRWRSFHAKFNRYLSTCTTDRDLLSNWSMTVSFLARMQLDVAY